MAESVDAPRVPVTRGLASYYENSWIADPVRRRAFVNFVRPDPRSIVLDVATGPGYNAFAFAERVRRVIGMDDSELALIRAEALRRERRLGHVEFMVGDAQEIPFDNDLFEIVTCTIILHHFEDPAAVIAEMARVCRPDGLVAIEDVIVPEDPVGAEHRETIERLRDASHVRFLSESELRRLIEQVGLSVVRSDVVTSERRFSEWIAVTRPDPGVADAIRRRLRDEARCARAGLQVRDLGDDLAFIQPIYRVVVHAA